MRHFEVELREDGARRVVAYWPNPQTGQVEREPVGEWGRPGFTIEEARYLKLKGELAAFKREGGAASAAGEVDEQWV